MTTLYEDHMFKDTNTIPEIRIRIPTFALGPVQIRENVFAIKTGLCRRFLIWNGRLIRQLAKLFQNHQICHR